ncbi:MAG: methyltransferase [Bradyrhizobium sp.]|uniref:class I SAM-dependent methyltransferase n=1 Tax=Bradyrhizobium sp. TaxID=376 RepID=UPI001DAAE311|nr:class I SAM-dependent methyltransferase [Bradyrhizobium sp.]MBV9559284.1 methyltransferase [Bradyrhizobium sp.]
MARTSKRRSASGSREETELATVHAGISDYYSAKVRKFGTTPPGVDWTCLPTQELRFVQLLRMCDVTSPFSLNDLGCGYGALLSYLDRYHPASRIDYLGIDLSPAMLRRARRLWHNRANVAFAQGSFSQRLADYSVASGIFNVQQDQPRDVWERFVAVTLRRLHGTSRRGFAVNFIDAGSVARDGIYSAEPAQWSRYCIRELGATTEIIDGYGLREFTLVVRRAA